MRPTAILAILLLLPLATGQAPDHRDDLALDHPANAVAITAAGARIAVGLEDEGSANTPLDEKDQVTWVVYDVLDDAYNLAQSGGADPSTCDQPTVIGQSCSSDVRHVALSADGAKGAVAARSSASTSQVILFETRSGEKHHVQIEGVVTSLDMDALGGTIVVGVDGSGVGAADSGIQVWLWDTSISTWDKTTDDPVTAVDVSDDGARIVAVAGQETVIYGSAENAPVLKDNWAPRSVTAAAVSSHKDHITVAGGDRGTIRVYEEDSDGAMARELNIPGNQVAIGAIAIKQDGTQMAVGFDDGRLAVWDLRDGPVSLEMRHVNEDIGTTITHLEYSSDGSHLLIGQGERIQLWAAEAPLERLWNSTLPAAATGLATNADGDAIAATFGSSLRLYEAAHDVAIAAAGPSTIRPGENKTFLVTLENTGDRRANGTLAVDAPGAWEVWVEDPQVSLVPAAKTTVRVSLALPATAPPASHDVVFSLPTEANDYSITKDITVPTVEKWGLTRNGAPASLPIEGGQPAEFTLKLRNEGNVDKVPPISLTASPSGWTASIVSGGGKLAPGQGRDLVISLSAPSGAAQLAQGTATVSVPGADPIELVGTVGARFEVRIVDPGTILLIPGNQTTFSITVQNQGNAPDSYRLDWGAVPTGWILFFEAGSDVATVRDVPAGGQKTVQAHITAPVDASGPPLEVRLAAVSLADAGATDTADFRFQTQETTTTTKKDDGGIPGPGLMLVVGAVALALLVRRKD